MKGTVSISVDAATLRAQIPKAMQYAEQEGFNEKGKPKSAFFTMERDEKVSIDELSDDSIGLSIDTPFGNVSMWFQPDAEFLKNVAEIAIARTQEAIKILGKGGN